jgi:hypothetical protein
MTSKSVAALLIVDLLAVSVPGFGHHSFPGVYDTDQQLILSGTATQFLFRNPHAFIYLSVTNDAGEAQVWHLELPPAVALSRRGMTGDAIRPGDALLVTCNPARDGARSCGLGQRGGFYRSSDSFLFGRDPRTDMERSQ